MTYLIEALTIVSLLLTYRIISLIKNKNMKNFKITTKTKIVRNEGVKGESLEDKLERLQNNKEPIKEGAPIIYTERKDGVRPEYNIRTDRMEVAIEGTTKISKSFRARREDAQKKRNGKPESIDTETEVGSEPQQ